MRSILIFLLLSVSLAALAVANLFFGGVDIPASEVWDVLLTRSSHTDAVSFIILENRLPQLLTAILAGAALAVSGLLLQTSFRNPLAGPSILGISSGASLGVAIVTLLFGTSFTLGNLSLGGSAAVMTGALMGSLTVMLILILLSARIRNNIVLLITGILLGYLTSSVVTLLSSVSTADGLQTYVMWGMGTFGNVSMKELPLFASATLAALLLSMLLVKPLNILLLGDNYARNLGVNLPLTRTLILLSTGVLTAVATAYCGPIAFVGLAIPHICRMLFITDNHRILLPASILAGGIVCLLCNLLSVAIASTVIPINALTPLVGVPVILYVILRRR